MAYVSPQRISDFSVVEDLGANDTNGVKKASLHVIQDNNTSTTSKASSTSDSSAPAIHTAAQIVYAAAGAGVSNVISGVAVSYDVDPVGGNLLIKDGTNTIFSLDIVSKGTIIIPFSPPKKGTANTSMTITLADGGALITGKLNVLGHWTE